MSYKDQGTEFEFTVVLKFNHSSFPQSGCTSIAGALFGYLFGQTKRYSVIFSNTNSIK